MHWIWKVLICLNLIGLIWTYLTVAAVWRRLQRNEAALLETLRALNALWEVTMAHHNIFVAVAEQTKKPPFPQAPDTSVN